MFAVMEVPRMSDSIEITSSTAAEVTIKAIDTSTSTEYTDNCMVKYRVTFNPDGKKFARATWYNHFEETLKTEHYESLDELPENVREEALSRWDKQYKHLRHSAEITPEKVTD